MHAIAAFSRPDRRRWTVALDLHYVPFYGDRSAVGVMGGPTQGGTHFFHCYTTAALLHRRWRYTVGLHTVERGTPLDPLVATVLDQIAARRLTVGGVTLDTGVDSGDVLRLLQQRGHSYVFPLRRKGGGRNRRNDDFALPTGTLTTVEWLTRREKRAVSTRVLVWQRAGEATPRVSAFGGWGSGAEVRRAWLARQRFGIETNSWQKNQARGWTTSADPAYWTSPLVVLEFTLQRDS